MDRCGRPSTPVELKALRFGLCGPLWTAMDAAWPSTDQEVGGSSPSGRATEVPASAGVSAGTGFADDRLTDRWEPFSI